METVRCCGCSMRTGLTVLSCFEFLGVFVNLFGIMVVYGYDKEKTNHQISIAVEIIIVLVNLFLFFPIIICFCGYLCDSDSKLFQKDTSKFRKQVLIGFNVMVVRSVLISILRFVLIYTSPEFLHFENRKRPQPTNTKGQFFGSLVGILFVLYWRKTCVLWIEERKKVES